MSERTGERTSEKKSERMSEGTNKGPSERASKRPSKRVNETKKHRAKEVRVIKRVQLFGFLLAHTYSDYYKLRSY